MPCHQGERRGVGRSGSLKVIFGHGIGGERRNYWALLRAFHTRPAAALVVVGGIIPDGYYRNLRGCRVRFVPEMCIKKSHIRFCDNRLGWSRNNLERPALWKKFRLRNPGPAFLINSMAWLDGFFRCPTISGSHWLGGGRLLVLGKWPSCIDPQDRSGGVGVTICGNVGGSSGCVGRNGCRFYAGRHQSSRQTVTPGDLIRARPSVRFAIGSRSRDILQNMLARV